MKFWNSEGLRDPAKHRFIQESVRDLRLDFIALLEIGRSNFSNPFLRHLARGLDFAWYCLPPQGRSGGILVGFNTSFFMSIGSILEITVSNFTFALKRMALSGFWCQFTGLRKMSTKPSP